MDHILSNKISIPSTTNDIILSKIIDTSYSNIVPSKTLSTSTHRNKKAILIDIPSSSSATTTATTNNNNTVNTDNNSTNKYEIQFESISPSSPNIMRVDNCLGLNTLTTGLNDISSPINMLDIPIDAIQTPYSIPQIKSYSVSNTCDTFNTKYIPYLNNINTGTLSTFFYDYIQNEQYKKVDTSHKLYLTPIDNNKMLNPINYSKFNIRSPSLILSHDGENQQNLQYNSISTIMNEANKNDTKLLLSPFLKYNVSPHTDDIKNKDIQKVTAVLHDNNNNKQSCTKTLQDEKNLFDTIYTNEQYDMIVMSNNCELKSTNCISPVTDIRYNIPTDITINDTIINTNYEHGTIEPLKSNLFKDKQMISSCNTTALPKMILVSSCNIKSDNNINKINTKELLPNINKTNTKELLSNINTTDPSPSLSSSSSSSLSPTSSSLSLSISKSSSSSSSSSSSYLSVPSRSEYNDTKKIFDKEFFYPQQTDLQVYDISIPSPSYTSSSSNISTSSINTILTTYINNDNKNSIPCINTTPNSCSFPTSLQNISLDHPLSLLNMSNDNTIKRKSSNIIDIKNYNVLSNSSINNINPSIILPSSNIIIKSKKSKKISLNTNPKFHTCIECGKCFTRSSNLVRHIRIHRHERRFHCEYCDKRFQERHHLVAHIRSHSSNTQYKCQFCPCIFPHKTSYLRHRQLCHSDIKNTIYSAN